MSKKFEYRIVDDKGQVSYEAAAVWQDEDIARFIAMVQKRHPRVQYSDPPDGTSESHDATPAESFDMWAGDLNRRQVQDIFYFERDQVSPPNVEYVPIPGSGSPAPGFPPSKAPEWAAPFLSPSAPADPTPE